MMGLFSRKKNTSNQEITLIGIKGQIATMKCLIMAGIKNISLKTTLAADVDVDQINSYQLLDTSDKAPKITQGDFSVSGARSILTYLDIRGKGNSLTPKKARTLGEQNYWIDVCYQTLGPVTQAIMSGSANDADNSALKQVLSSLNTCLTDNDYIVGQLSFADPNVAAYIYALGCAGIDLTAYPNIGDWITRLEKDMSGPLSIEYLPMPSSHANSQVA